MAQLTSVLRQEELGSVSYKLLKNTLPWCDGSPSHLSHAQTMSQLKPEATACLAAVRLAIEYYSQCLARGIPQKGIVIHGDILPLLSYLQEKGV